MLFAPLTCFFSDEAESQSAKFCPDCGCAKDDASRVCSKYQKDQETIAEYRQTSEEMLALVPYQDDYLKELWADYFAVVLKQMSHGVFGRWTERSFREVALKLKNGSWGLQKVSYPLLKGSIQQITYRRHYYGKTWYWQREWADMVFARIEKKQYLSRKQIQSIVARLIAKHGHHDGQYYCEASRSMVQDSKWGTWASGPFCPVNHGTQGPAYKDACYICNEGLAAGVIYPSETQGQRLYDEWPDSAEIQYGTSICNSPVCQEADGWLAGKNNVLIREARKLNVTPNRPAKVTLEKYPEEVRGSLILARYLDFQARYTDKMNTVTKQ